MRVYSLSMTTLWPKMLGKCESWPSLSQAKQHALCTNYG
jgi:hypothetical protein